MRTLSSWLLVLGWCVVTTSLGLFTGCKGDGADGAQSGRVSTASRASRVPQRIADEVTAYEDAAGFGAGDGYGSKRFGADAGIIAVEPLKDGEPLRPDSITSREASGVLLDVEWKLSDLPAPSGAPETSLDGLEVAREKTRLRMRVEIAAIGRLQITFLGQGFPWPEGTELRARADKYGYVLAWPGGKSYRTIVPGALRALFTDRRLDQGPLFTPKLTTLAAGQWLGQPTERVVLSTPVAEMQLDQSTVPGTGFGAPLLCRLLVELAAIEPSFHLCSNDQLPLHAQFTNAPGGRLTFTATLLGKKQELPIPDIQVPPERAVFQSTGMPSISGGAIERTLLSSLRHRAVTSATPVNSTAILTPTTGLAASNRALALRALVVDGIVVAWLSPGSELLLPELRNGQYSIAWRDFFGSNLEAPRNVVLPARVTLGGLRDNGN
jgi:hypothetical protein